MCEKAYGIAEKKTTEMSTDSFIWITNVLYDQQSP